MDEKVRRRLLIGSTLCGLVGATVAVVYFFQPWRSCEDEDTSAGCAMLPVDATVMAVSVIVTLVAVGVFVLALLAMERPVVR